MYSSADGKEKFRKDLERILIDENFRVNSSGKRSRLRSLFVSPDSRELALMGDRKGVVISTSSDKVLDLYKKLGKKGFPITSLQKFDEKWTMRILTPSEYLFDEVPLDTISKLKSGVTSAVDGVAYDNLLNNKINFYEKSMLSYPDRMLKELSMFNIPKSEMHIVDWLSEISGKIKRQDTKDDPELEAILDATYNNYEINVLSTRDKYTKVMNMAKKSRICWREDDAKNLAINTYNDFTKNSGTIVYTVSLNKEVVGFGRDFVCVDRQGSTHLFMELLEGVTINKRYYHGLMDWSTIGYIGALKAGILFNIYLAKEIGTDYLTLGGAGPEEFFSLLGARRTRLNIRTEDGLRTFKLGYPAFEHADSTSVNVVRRWQMPNERYHTIRVADFPDYKQ